MAGVVDVSLATSAFIIVILAPSTFGCGSLLEATRTPQVVTTPGYPQFYPTEKFCNWTIQTSFPGAIYVKITEFNEYGCCRQLQVIDGGVPIFTTGQRAQNVNLILNTTSSSVTIRGNPFGTKVLLRMEFYVVDRCGFSNNLGAGQLSSPAPSPVKNYKCGWNLRRPAGGRLTNAFIMTVTNIQIESGIFEVYSSMRRLAVNPKNGSTFYDESLLRVFYDSGNGSTSASFSAVYSNDVCNKTLVATSQVQTLSPPGYPVSNYWYGLTCEWKILPSANSNRTVYLKLTKLDYTKSFKINDQGATQFTDFNSFRGRNGNWQTVITASAAVITVELSSGSNGFELSYSEVPRCGFYTLGNPGEFKTPNYPQPLPANSKCGWIAIRNPVLQSESFVLSVRFTSVLKSSDVFQVYNDNKPLITVDLQNTTTKEFAGTKSLRIFYATGNTSGGPSFTATHKYGACNTTLYASPDIQKFTTPGYPQLMRNTDCAWTILASSPSKTCHLSLSDFSRRVGDTEIWFDGNYGGKFTGFGSKKLNFIGRNLTVRFTSSYPRPGFVGLYQEVENCGFLTNSTVGNISSPNYPDVATPGLKCQWTVMSSLGAAAGSKLFSLELRNYNFQKDKDTFQLYNGRSDLMARSSDITTAVRFYEKGAFLRVFYATSTSTRSNFFATHQLETCGGNLTARQKQQALVSPGYPIKYIGQISCTWTIHVIPDRSIYISLLYMDSSSLGIKSGSVQIAVASSYQPRVNTVVQNSSAQIVFQGFSGKGFVLNYTMVRTCGFINRNIQQEKSFPNSTQIRNAVQRRPCYWRFPDGPGKLLKIRMTLLRNRNPGELLEVYGRVKKFENMLNETLQQVEFYNQNELTVFWYATENNWKDPLFRASYKTQVCSGTLFANATTQHLTIGNNVRTYAVYTSCYWTIRTTNSKKSIYFQVSANFNDNDNSSKAFRQSRYGLLISFRYSVQNVQFITHGSSNSLRFTWSNTGGRFRLRHSFIEVDRCGFETANNNGTVTSPSYPASANSSLICGWTFGGWGATMFINFTALHIAPGDEMLIYDNTMLLNSGPTKNSTIFYSGSILRIVFKTSRNSKGSYFSANHSSANFGNCVINLTANDSLQFFSSPGYPYTYGMWSSCHWTIDSSNPLGFIFITIVNLDVYNRTANLRINDADKQIFYGDRPVKNVKIISKKRAFLSFNAKGFNGGRGFTLNYREGLCPTNVSSNCHAKASCNVGANNVWECKCNAGYQGDGNTCTISCKEQSIQHQGRSFDFVTTQVGFSAVSKQTCPDGRAKAFAICNLTTFRPLAQVARLSLLEPVWTEEHPSVEVMQSPTPTTRPTTTSDQGTLGNISVVNCSLNLLQFIHERSAKKEAATTESVAESVATIKLLTSTNKSLTENETTAVAQTLSLLSKKDPTKVKITLSTLYDTLLITDRVSTSIASENSKLGKRKSTRQQQQTLIKVLQDFVGRVEMQENQTTITLDTRGLAVEVTMQTKVAERFNDVTFQPRDATGALYVPPISALVPGSLLDSISSESSARVSFILHKTNSLFPPGDGKLSKVLSVHVKPAKAVRNQQPITITFNNVTERQGSVPLKSNRLKENVTRTMCVSLDKDFRWTSDNCKLVLDQGAGNSSKPRRRRDLESEHLNEDRDSGPQFEYYQFGHFAMIIKSAVLPSAHALHVATIVGCSISMASLLATFIIYCSIAQLRIKKPTFYLLNICVCLFVANLVFVVGHGNVGKRVECYLSTAILHYFLLAAWFWTSANAYDLYSALVKVMRTSAQKIRTVAAVTSYVIPLVVVLINAGVTIFSIDAKLYRPDDNLFNSAYRARHICWLHLYSLNFGFLLPVGLLALFNFCLFIVVFSSLTCRKQQIRSTAQGRSSAQDFMLAVTLILMLGLTWVFGFLMLVSENVSYLEAMSWLFTIVNSLQGFFIFLVNCVRNPSVRSLWLGPIAKACGCATDTATSSKRTSSTASGQRTKSNPDTSQM